MLVLNKEYMIFKPEIKATKTGKTFTQFTVSDSTKTADGYKNEYYRMKIYHDGSLQLEDRQKVTFKTFYGIACYTNEYNGKTYNNKDIYCTIDNNNTNNNSNETQDNESYVSIEASNMIKDDDIPF